MNRSTIRPMRIGIGAAAVAAALVLASCSSSPTTTSDTEDADLPEALNITSFLAHTGTQASAVAPLIAATQLAINDINAAGGVFGADVVYVEQDSTSDNDTAATAADSVISSDANIVIGPYGSGMGAAVIPQITEAGIVEISGSNTSSALTGISPLYFRTAPTDALESAQLADLIAGDGHSSVGIIWQNDAWGAAFEEGMVANLEAAGIEVAANESFNVEEADYSAQVNAVVAAQPDAVVFLSYATYSGAMIEQLVGTNGFPSANVYFSSSTLGDYSASVSNLAYLEGVQAFQPGADVETEAEFETRVKEIDPSLTAFAYAASTYDATILGALAAEVAKSTEAEDIAEALAEISGPNDGESCSTYADCLAILEDGGTIDYDGLTGTIEFDDKNDVGATNYLHFVYAADGTYAVK
ncbi:MAG: ABC transporter substrate-binding protein [Microbacterium sp.]